MSEPRQEGLDDEVAEAAATWLMRLEGSEATAEDWSAFSDWLQAAPQHLEAYERMERLSLELDARAGEIAAGLSAPARVRSLRSAAPSRRILWLGGGAALAASLAVGVVILAPRPVQTPPVQTYAAAAGEIREVRLADGTQVRLNAASVLRVSFERDVRRVELGDGEAAFDVTHDPNRPFVIAVGDSQVRVVGTQFDLRHRDGRMALTVRRGVVEVRPGAAAARPVRVAAGEQLAHRDGAPGAQVASVDPDDAFAWTEGQLVYRDAPLAEVAADLTRRFGRPVRLADPRTAELRFTGVLVTDDPAAVLRRLESFAPVKADQTPDGFVLRRAD